MTKDVFIPHKDVPKKEKVLLSIDKKVLSDVDIKCKHYNLSRSSFVEQCILFAIDRIEME